MPMFPITVQPGMLMPISVGPEILGQIDNSMNVSFEVQMPSFAGISILFSICITIQIDGRSVRICYTRYVLANGQIEYFNCLLPIGSVIQKVVTSYVVVETVLI